MPEWLRLRSGQVASEVMRAEPRAGASYYSGAGQPGHEQVTRAAKHSAARGAGVKSTPFAFSFKGTSSTPRTVQTLSKTAISFFPSNKWLIVKEVAAFSEE